MNAAKLAPTAEDAPAPDEPSDLSTAETADCQCPDFCERDHDLD
jgi:hypothetical protein